MNWRSRFAQQPIGEPHCFYAVISPVWKLRNEVMLVSFLKEDCSFNFTLVQLSSYIIFVYGFIRLSPCFNEDVVIATVFFIVIGRKLAAFLMILISTVVLSALSVILNFGKQFIQPACRYLPMKQKNICLQQRGFSSSPFFNCTRLIR